MYQEEMEVAHLQLTQRDLQWIAKNNVTVLTKADERYPPLLKEIAHPPRMLFAQGDVSLLQQSQIAIVGTRNPSVTGKELATQFARCLAEQQLIITSGMAIGIDTACHLGAMQAGKTIAVLGSGLAKIYPRSNQKLAQQIIENGLLISEFLPDTPPAARNFPLRNRIISGLSLGVLVVEATLRSGSLITAKFALEQNREIFAIPGSIHNPMARGCHHLLRQGAKLVEKAEDVLEELKWLRNPIQSDSSRKKIPKNQRVILKHIGYEATPMETITMRSGLTAGEVSSILLSLELTGQIVFKAGGYLRTV